MTVRIMQGDCRAILKGLPDQSVHMVVTSPPYFALRDYGMDNQIGLESHPDDYVAELVTVFREVWRVLRDDGTLWLNLGDSYAGSGRGGNPTEASSTLQGGQDGQKASMIRRARGSEEVGTSARDAAVTNMGRRVTREAGGFKEKDLLGIPWAVAFALRADGWYLRQEIVWAKPNGMPESVEDRCTKSHEQLFLLSKTPRYFFDATAIAEPAIKADSGNLERKPASARGTPEGTGKNQAGSVPWSGSTRNKRSVWTVATAPFKEAHFATFPPDLIEPCILAGTSARGVCSACGAPWGRVVEKTRENGSGSGVAGKLPKGKAPPKNASQAGTEDDIRNGPIITRRTVGWAAGCTCEGAGVIPATVLDPFGGAGTTGLVADRHHRDAILVELNPDYIAMAKARLRKDAKLFASVTD